VIEVTRLAAQDRARWTALWTTYLSFYGTSLPDEQFAYTWDRIIGDAELHGFAARDGAEIVGIVHFLFHASAWTSTPVCYLQDLFVTQEARGKGIGRILIEAVAAHAHERDSARLYWLTQDHNATARQLYDRLAKHSGFIRYEYPL